MTKASNTQLNIRGPEDFARAFGVSRETLDRLARYESLLKTWQNTINLVAPSTLDHVWQRHFADSAQLDALAPAAAKTWLDLGSGAGFPGLVIAILRAELGETRVRLVESDARKAAFLREVARTAGIAVDIVATRIESAANSDTVRVSDVVSARALAPLTKLLGLAQPFFGPETVGIFPKGRDLAAELDQAREKWSFACVVEPSRTDSEAGMAVITELSAR